MVFDFGTQDPPDLSGGDAGAVIPYLYNDEFEHDTVVSGSWMAYGFTDEFHRSTESNLSRPVLIMGGWGGGGMVRSRSFTCLIRETTHNYEKKPNRDGASKNYSSTHHVCGEGKWNGPGLPGSSRCGLRK